MVTNQTLPPTVIFTESGEILLWVFPNLITPTPDRKFGFKGDALVPPSFVFLLRIVDNLITSVGCRHKLWYLTWEIFPRQTNIQNRILVVTGWKVAERMEGSPIQIHWVLANPRLEIQSLKCWQTGTQKFLSLDSKMQIKKEQHSYLWTIATKPSVLFEIFIPKNHGFRRVSGTVEYGKG